MEALLPLALLGLAAYTWWLVSRRKPPTNQRAAPAATKAAASRAPRPASPTHWPATDDFDFDIVGESNYQRALAALARDSASDAPEREHTATLIPEDDNRHDNKAVQVQIAGQTVGYLARDDARSFRRRLGQKGLTGKRTTCGALITGGGTNRQGDKLHFGVRLALKPFEER